jgi:WD40 repeat protein
VHKECESNELKIEKMH